ATGRWPTRDCGDIAGTIGETWLGVDRALRYGLRNLPGGSSLPQLLAEKFGVRNVHGLPPLTVEQILVWADEHRARTGIWPTATSGSIVDAPGETWTAVEVALVQGRRGLALAGGSSLALLLAEHRGVRNFWSRPDLTIEQILAWADAHHQRTGRWPTL